MCVILDKYRFPWSLAKVKWDIECWEHPVSISSTNQRYRWYPIGKFVLPENKTDVFSILLFFRHSICCNSSWARLCVWHHLPFPELLKLHVQHRSLFIQSYIMAPPSIFYHYTSKESLEGILATNTIFCSTPHPATPGLLGGYVIKSGVFLTRMDPNNSKAAIALNNYRWQHPIF